MQKGHSDKAVSMKQSQEHDVNKSTTTAHSNKPNKRDAQVYLLSTCFSFVTD